MWLAYLAGVTVGFEDGPMRIYQTVATRQAGAASLPPTRADLYAKVPAGAAAALEPA
jgi:cyclopropane-fatty-acyl-phospholipid synthase